MLLKELAEKKTDELEVWDEEVDVSCPVYLYGGHAYEDSERDHFLYLMEEWFLGLEVTTINDGSCCVNVFEELQKNMPTADDDEVADCVEDFFTVLSMGVYGYAKRFCSSMNL